MGAAEACPLTRWAKDALLVHVATAHSKVQEIYVTMLVDLEPAHGVVRRLYITERQAVVTVK